jgi:hypothetical protein
MIKMILCYQKRNSRFLSCSCIKRYFEYSLRTFWGENLQILISFSVYSANEALFLCWDGTQNCCHLSTTKIYYKYFYFLRIQQTTCYAVLVKTGYEYDTV